MCEDESYPFPLEGYFILGGKQVPYRIVPLPAPIAWLRDKAGIYYLNRSLFEKNWKGGSK